MLTSNIKKDVQYTVTNSIDKIDIDKEAYVYNAKIYNKHIKFVLGTPNFEHISNGVLYFNIYLVNNGSVISKIGIYETNNTEFTSLLDFNGDVYLNKLAEPIIFPFSKSMIINNYELLDDFETKSNTSKNSDASNYEESETDAETDAESDVESDAESLSREKTKSNINYDLLSLISQTKEESDD